VWKCAWVINWGVVEAEYWMVAADGVCLFYFVLGRVFEIMKYYYWLSHGDVTCNVRHSRRGGYIWLWHACSFQSLLFHHLLNLTWVILVFHHNVSSFIQGTHTWDPLSLIIISLLHSKLHNNLYSPPISITHYRHNVIIYFLFFFSFLYFYTLFYQ